MLTDRVPSSGEPNQLNIDGNSSTGADLIGRDKQIGRDSVGGDAFGGDKIGGNSIRVDTLNINQTQISEDGTVRRRGLHLTINSDYGSYSQAKKAKLKRVIDALLMLDEEVVITKIAPGSVNAYIEVPYDKVEALFKLFEQGKLAELDVVDITLTDDSPSPEQAVALQEKTPKFIKIDEREYVERPLLEQLHRLGWEIIDLDRQQKPQHSYRESFSDVVMGSVLREQLQVINPWLEPEQVEDVVKQLTASFSTTNLLENNRFVHTLLLENSSVPVNRKTDETSPTVRLIEFRPSNLQNNRFIAICQFKVRILGSDQHIFPDIVLFLNGLPVAVIEAKSPRVKGPIPEAIDQLMRYSEQRGDKGEGSAALFYYNQFIVATCRTQSKFGTITTHSEKHFYRWADPYPRTLQDLVRDLAPEQTTDEKGSAKSPNDQQRLVAGMLDHQNLLDLIRTFTLFSTNDRGQSIKIVGRYQQFRAVKLGIQRLLTGNTPQERSGIIWHTQGSGKSLTMMFMVRAMYRHPQLAQWKVVFVTDRTQLEQQLAETAQNIGFTIKAADSIAKLKELLATDSSDLVMAMIHKFQDPELEEIFPVLNTSYRILVMTDEAHRSQYKKLRANLDRAIPNAAHFGYTGTPIDKTERVFGTYIDTYTMQDAIDDKVTLEIVYEGRTHNAEIVDQAGMDAAFEDVFSDYKLRERLEILGYGSRDAYLEAKSTIAAKAQDMVNHYLTHIFPNGFKAQVVATSRIAAARYKDAIDDVLAKTIAQLQIANPQGLNLKRLRKLRSDVVISGQHNDKQELKPYTNPTRHEATIKSFKLPFDVVDEGVSGDIGIIIVNEMLLTGFDAPIEQVMYLDRVIIAHNLLQAIARVNRVAGEGKDKGFIVDYVGIGHHLKRAIDSYREREQKEILEALRFPEEELNQLESDYKAIMELLASYGIKDFSDYDAFYDLFYNEEIRFDYMQAFKAFTRSLNALYPDKKALEYLNTYKLLAGINVMASQHLQDQRLNMKGIPDKLRTITDAYLVSKGIEQKVAPISIMDDNFEAEVNQRTRVKTKAATVEHAIRHYIEIELEDDPELQASFAQSLADILAIFKDNWEQIYIELEKLRQRIRATESEPTYGLNKKTQMPFFRMLKGEFENAAPQGPLVMRESRPLYGPEIEKEAKRVQAVEEQKIAQLVDLTQRIYHEVARELKLVGFWENIPARQKLREDLQKVLLSESFARMPGMLQNREKIISRMMEIAEKNNEAIVYAV